MRRSTRLQLQKQRTGARLASVPELDNEDGEAVESVQPEEAQAPQATPARAEAMPPPQPAPVVDPSKLNISGALPTASLYFSADLRPPPLRFWRRQSWIHCTRGNLPHAPMLPPPPSLIRARPPPLFQCAGYAIEEGKEEEDKMKANGKVKNGPLKAPGGVGEENRFPPRQPQQQGVVARGQFRPRTQGRPEQIASRPNYPMTPPQLTGPFRPPPPYNVAVAHKQQQLAALKASAEKEEKQDTPKPTNGHHSKAEDDPAGKNSQNGTVSGAAADDAKKEDCCAVAAAPKSFCGGCGGINTNANRSSLDHTTLTTRAQPKIHGEKTGNGEDTKIQLQSVLEQLLKAGTKLELERQADAIRRGITAERSETLPTDNELRPDAEKKNLTNN